MCLSQKMVCHVSMQWEKLNFILSFQMSAYLLMKFIYIAEVTSYSAYYENRFCFPGNPVEQHILLLWGILRSKV